MNQTRLCLGIVFTVLLNAGQAFAQNELVKKLSASLEELYKKAPAEKVHLHFDRPFYSAGDTIWFKAYLVDESNLLTEHSKVLNIDLIDENDLILRSLKISLIAGLGSGDFVLNQKTKGGNYRVRAYTNWMRNFDEAYFFNKVIPISDVFASRISSSAVYTYSGDKLIADIEYKSIDDIPLSNTEVWYTLPKDAKRKLSGKERTDLNGMLRISIDTSDLTFSHSLITNLKVDKDTITKGIIIPEVLKDFDVQFFPEGGELVEHIPSRVAFKVTGSNGLGIEASGYITNSAGSKISDFQTEHNGMGVFSLNPQRGESYSAYVRLSNGLDKIISLPPALSTGYVMTVSEEGEDIVIKARVIYQLLKENDLTLVVQSKGRIYGTSHTVVDKSLLTVRISKVTLPTGIVQLTLFSGVNNPVAERLVFVDNSEENYELEITPVKRDYATKDRVRLKLNVRDNYGRPALGSFSMSVTDESKVPFDEEKETTIQSNLLLTSDLKGYIEKPNYYFTEKTEEKKRHLDLLMMTQGWRRFEWKDVTAAGIPEIKFAPETSLKISGKVLTAMNSPVVNGTVNLVIPGQGIPIQNTVTNSMGEFEFDSLDYEGEVNLILQARNEKERSNVNIVLDSVLALSVASLNIPVADNLPALDSTVIAEADESYLNEMKRFAELNKARVLDEVKVTAVRKRKVEGTANLNPRDPQYVFLEDDLKMGYSLGQILKGKVPGVIFTDKHAVLIKAMQRSVMGTGYMQIFIDGTPMKEMTLDEIDLNTVAGVEVLSQYSEFAIYGSYPGVILITTKIASQPKSRGPQMGELIKKVEGYVVERQFYSPVYGDPKVPDPFRDLRKTIFWEPYIMPNRNGIADVSFFTAQRPGIYKIVIEGIYENGIVTRKILRKEVR